jgi:chromosome segregation ATPase
MATTDSNPTHARPAGEMGDSLAAALGELEARVKAALALVAQLRDANARLKRRIGELEATISSQAEQVKALQSARTKDQEHLHRVQEEREGIRSRVDRLLQEIGEIEAAVDPGLRA